MNELQASGGILLLLIAAFVGFSLLGSQNQPQAVFETGTVDSVVNVEIADNETERSQGLMNRQSICESCGMIFIFENAERRAFWMKNTSIPLDIIFISSDQEVVNVAQADPEPGVSDENLTRYRSEEPAKYVVEVNQGFAEEKNIVEGTEVNFRSIPLNQ